MATTERSLAEDFQWPAEALVLTQLRSFTRAIDARLKPLTDQSQEYAETVSYLRGILIDRLNEVLGPAQEQLDVLLSSDYFFELYKAADRETFLGFLDLGVQHVDGAAPLDSPQLIGAPTAPTAGAGTSTQQLATTAFVMAAIAKVLGTATTAGDTLGEIEARVVALIGTATAASDTLGEIETNANLNRAAAADTAVAMAIALG